MKNAIRLALSALSIVVLTACGGGTSNSTVSQTSTGFTVEGGLAQKGPLLKGSRVTISELNPLNYQPSGLGYDILTKDNKGGFTSSGINFTRQHVQTFAQGYYFNEITGTLASDSVMLQAQGDLTLDRLVNVNLLTTLAGPRTVALVTDSTNAYGLSTYRNFAASRTQAQKEVLAAFRIYNVADMMNTDTSSTTVTVPNNFSELDIAKGATLNKILVTLSALVMKVGTNGVGVSQFIANFQLDLVDDGLINGSAGSSALRASIDTASLPANLDLTAVASNLNTFYALPLNLNALTGTTFTAAQLTPWVDSSGGTDLVVDKFKSSSTTAVAYTESKSATYTAGTDDAGTCFSVGSVTTGATGALYRVTTGTTTTYTAVTTPVLVTKGQSVVLGLTATAAGTYAGFIRRSAATAGVCPTTTPTTGTTRLQKYSITATAAATVPGAPTIGTATPDVAQASVAFTAPTSIGSSAITGYKASCVIGTGTAITATNPVSPVLVTGLTGGSLYSCTVQATNTAGYGAASLAVTVTPVAAVAPGAPTIGTVSAGNARASVAYTAPSSSGSSAITGYTASCALGTATPVTTTGTVNPLVVTGLTNGSLYSCTVTATNSAGTSVASSAVSVRPVDGVTVVPTKPTITSATAGAAQITVAFTAATSGTTATSYTATCGTQTATGPTSPLVVTGLTNGTAYTCTVTASNAGGVSVPSTSSTSATPSATTASIPNAPTINTVFGATSSVLIKFTAASTGGTPSYYKATCTASGSSTAISSDKFSASPIALSGLTSGIAYSCSVLAGNSAGDSSASLPVSATPISSSTALVTPNVNGVLPGDGRISVQFNYIGGKVTTQITTSTYSPASGYFALCTSSDGGVSNTNFGSAEYNSDTGANITNPLVVSGLTNGKTYTCSVRGFMLDSTGSKYYLATSTASSPTIPNAGPSNASGVLASTANTTHITTYPAYSSYCGYTNQSATGAGAVPSITYSTSSSATTTGTSAAAFTCTGTTTRTLTGNALPDHLSSQFFTNGLSPYTGTPYFSGNPNKIGTTTVSKAMPYSGTISTAYSMGTNGYDTSSCYAYTTTMSPSNTTSAGSTTTTTTYNNTSGTYRCKFVSYNYANNSVLIEPGTAETYTGTTTTYKVVGKNLYQDVGLDPSNAHNQPTIVPGSTNLAYGNYHYHGVPEGHVARIGKGNSTMTLVAFAADGFPIYARYGYSTRTSSTGGVKVMKSNYRLRTAAELTAAGYTDRPSVALAPYGTFEQDWVFDAATAGGDLDACNGRYGVTPESPTTEVYHYFITDSYPFIQRCVFGQNPATWAN